MPLLRDTVFPLANYPTGTQNFGPLNVADDVSRVRFEVQRCTTADPTIWPNASTTLNIATEVSFDNGASWQAWSGFGAGGGIVGNIFGGEWSVSYMEFPLPAGTQRKLRGEVVIVDGPLRSSATLETE